jgi:hypothetical protein
MSKNDLGSGLRARVDAFVADLSQLIREEALDAVRQALGASAAPAPRRTRKAAPVARKGRGRSRRSSADLESLASALQSHVKSNPGQRLEQIGAAMGIDTKELKRPVQLLLGAGSLRTEGQRRGTKYFAGGGSRRGSKARGSKRGRRKTARRKAGKRRGARRASVQAAA